MAKISLTASMRSNLLSLQKTSNLMDLTQERLSTGKKVNSAIDNPSSFYTARSLNNRASDLDALLDSMGQGIQTIKAATTALETGVEILQQASAVATQTLTDASTNTVQFDIDKAINEQNAERSRRATGSAPDRNWLLANGADFVVETEAELRDALINATSGDKIVVNGKINVEINEASEKLFVAEGVELIGATALSENAINADGSYIGELNITNNINDYGIVFNGNNVLSELQLSHETSLQGAFINFNGGVIKNINVSNKGQRALILGSGSSEIKENINIKNEGPISHSEAITVHPAAIANIDASINIYTRRDYSHGIASSGVVNILNNSEINIKTEGYTAIPLNVQTKGMLNIVSAKMNLISKIDWVILNECWSADSGGNTIKISSDVEINAKGENFMCNAPSQTINPNTGLKENYIEIAEGAKIFFEDNDGNKGNYTSKEYVNSSVYGEDNLNVIDIGLAEIEQNGWIYEGNLFFPDDYSKHKQFSDILAQYDNLVNDGSYKGVNLLKNEDLKVYFNENQGSTLDIKGKDMSTDKLGIKTNSWVTAKDVLKSIEEIASAVQQIRNYNTELGNNYSIITNRQDFTENLINILTEGADKLTLADMNEESANMLALQTRQQLAINALSLASQASQGVLKLF